MNIINYCINLKLKYYNNYNSKYKMNINKYYLYDSYFSFFLYGPRGIYNFIKKWAKKGNNHNL